MKKTLMSILMVSFLVIVMAGTFPGSIRYEYYLTGDATGQEAYGEQYIGQTFTVGVTGTNVSFIFTGFAAKLYKDTGNNQTIFFNLMSTNGTTPQATLVTNTSFNVSVVQTGGVNSDWFNITMPSYTLVKGQTYAIVMNNSASSHKIRWRQDATEATYDGGDWLYTAILTGLWSVSDGTDNVFEIYGVETLPISNITVTLITPVDGAVISSSSVDLSGGYSCQNCNLTNATYFVWNSTGVVNDSVEININISTNLSTETITGLAFFEEYEWNIYTCADNSTAYLCSFSTTNYTLGVGASIDSTFHNLQSFETESEFFQLNVTLLTGSTFFGAKLVYDSAEHTVSDIENLGSGVYSLTRTIDLPLNPSPLANITNSFYWSFIYVDSSENQHEQNTSTTYQNASFINLQICNTTYDTTAVNFTYYDELNGEQIDASDNSTSMEVTFNYWLGSGTTYKNYSYQNLSNNNSNQYKFCIFPDDETFGVDMDMEYEAGDYSPRKYFFSSAVLTNDTSEVPLFLLPIDYSVKFFVTVKQGLTGFAGAFVTISKYFTGEGIYKTIGIRKTDDIGKFIEYFDIDQDYKFKVVRDNTDYGTISQHVTCQEAPCELTLQLEEAEVDLWSGYYDVFAPSVSYSLIYDNDDYMVTFDFTDLTGLAQYFRLLVTETKYNETSATICDNKLYTTSGTLYCNMTDYTGHFTATGYIHRNPGRIVDYITFVREVISEILGETGLFVAFMLIVTIALVGSWNPAVGVALTAFAVFGMSILGFAVMSWTTVVLVIVMALILMMKMKT